MSRREDPVVMNPVIKSAGKVFADDPEKAVRMLFEGGVVKADASAVAAFLFKNEAGWDTGKIWVFVSSFVGRDMPLHFASCCSMGGLPIDEALRTVLSHCTPCNATLSELDAILFAVAKAHNLANPSTHAHGLSSPCQAESYLVACLLLSFTLHPPPRPPARYPGPITRPRFIRGCSALDESIDESTSGGAYDRIKQAQFPGDVVLETTGFVDAVDSPAIHHQAWLRVQIAGRWRRCWGRVGETGFVCSRTPRLFGFDDEVLAHVPISGMMVVEECGELEGGDGAGREFLGFTVQGTPMSRTEVCARGEKRQPDKHQMKASGGDSPSRRGDDGRGCLDSSCRGKYIRIQCRVESEEEKETWVDAVIAVSQSALVFTDSRQRFGASSSSTTLVGQRELGSHPDHGHESSGKTQHADGEAASRNGDGSGGDVDAEEGGGVADCLVRHLQWEIRCLRASFQTALLDRAGRALTSHLSRRIDALIQQRCEWMERARRYYTAKEVFTAWSYCGWRPTLRSRKGAKARRERCDRVAKAAERSRCSALLSLSLSAWRLQASRARRADSEVDDPRACLVDRGRTAADRDSEVGASSPTDAGDVKVHVVEMLGTGGAARAQQDAEEAHHEVHNLPPPDRPLPSRPTSARPEHQTGRVPKNHSQTGQGVGGLGERPAGLEGEGPQVAASAGAGPFSSRASFPGTAVAAKERRRLLSRCIVWWRWSGSNAEPGDESP